MFPPSKWQDYEAGWIIKERGSVINVMPDLGADEKNIPYRGKNRQEKFSSGKIFVTNQNVTTFPRRIIPDT